MEAIRTILLEASAHRFLVGLMSIGLVIFALFVSAGVVKREPVGGGSGIPQVEAEMKGKMNANWLQVILAKFVGSLLAIGAGLSLGS